MKFKPIFDYVFLKDLEVERVTKGGILLSQEAQERPEMYEVAAVGPGGMIKGNYVEMKVKPGDKVITNKLAGSLIKFQGETYIVVHQSDILFVIEP